MSWQRTRYPGVFVRHRKTCPAAATADARCRCEPSFRAKRRDPVSGRVETSRSYRDRNEALSWLTGSERAAPALRERGAAGPTFGTLADEWWTGVEAGQIGKRRGKRGYSATTLQGYDRSLRNVLKPEFGTRPASEIVSQDWQLFVDRLARQGLSRSRIANHLAVVRAIYSWASRPTRQLVAGNPTLGVELPPVDERPRERAATAEEATQLLTPLDADDAVAYAIAFYTGLRRAEMDRLDWNDVDLEKLWLVVRKAKSAAGTGRRLPIAAPLKPILLEAYLRQRRPDDGRVLGSTSVTSGRLARRALKAWGWKVPKPGERAPSRARIWRAEQGDAIWYAARSDALEPIGLHECRHTYASFLMAAGYTLRELMEYMGHSSLQATERYVKLLPQPAGPDGAADRLNAYLAAAAAGAGPGK